MKTFGRLSKTGHFAPKFISKTGHFAPIFIEKTGQQIDETL